mgnify:CR=1 FL=1
MELGIEQKKKGSLYPPSRNRDRFQVSTIINTEMYERGSRDSRPIINHRKGRLAKLREPRTMNFARRIARHPLFLFLPVSRQLNATDINRASNDD